MPLPFLKNTKSNQTGVAVEYRKPDESSEDQGDHAMEAAAQDILRAVESKDYKHLAMAIRSAFEILDSEVHEEGPHTNDSEQE
jgi:hypothetical protein